MGNADGAEVKGCTVGEGTEVVGSSWTGGLLGFASTGISVEDSVNYAKVTAAGTYFARGDLRVSWFGSFHARKKY